MKNNLTTTNQNAKLALSKSKSLLNITNSLLAKKDIGQLIQSFKFKPFLKEKGYSNSVNSVVISLDGKTMVSGSDDNTIKIWDMQSGECLNTLEGHSRSISSLAISIDGKTVVSGSYDKTIKIWDMQSGESLHTLTGHSYDIGSLAISPDGKTIVSGGSWDNTIKIWDMQNGECLDTFPSILDTLEGHGHSRRVNSVAISPDGKTIVSGGGGTVKVINSDRKTIVNRSDDSTIKLWDIRGCLNTLEGHSNSVNSVAISLDGKTIVSGSDDSTIKLWDIQSGESLHALKGHSSGINSVAISSDGKTIVSGSRDGTIKLWDIQSGECIYTSYNMEDGSTITIFSDGSFNASEDNIDKFIRVNDIPLSCRKLTKKEIEYFCKIKYENKVTNSKISEIDNEIPF